MSYPKRVAVVGVGHWHSTYDAAYIDLLCALTALDCARAVTLIHDAYRLAR